MPNNTDYLALGLKSIALKDNSEFRKKMWSHFKNKSSLPLNLLEWSFNFSFVRFLIIRVRWLYGLYVLSRYSFPVWEKNSGWQLFHYTNEEKAILNLTDNLNFPFEKLIFGKAKLEHFITHLPFIIPALLNTYCSISLIEKNNFLVSLRQVDFLNSYHFWNLQFKTNLHRLPFCLISSSESNSEIIGPALAAKTHGIKLIFTNHGALSFEQGLFFHDSFALTNADTLDKVKTTLVDQQAPLFLIGSKLNSSEQIKPFTFDKIKSVYIVGSITTEPEKILKLIQNYSVHFGSLKFYYRSHPNPHMQTDMSGYEVEMVSFNERITEQAKKYDLILVGNSSAVQELIGAGLPVFSVDIDNAPQDLYGFQKRDFVADGNSATQLETEYKRVYLNENFSQIFNYYCEPENQKKMNELNGLLKNYLSFNSK